jgi:steroid delta-isomerase
MFEEEKHPARRASLLSREYVKTHNKEGWLGLYAEDAIIQDPIGKSYLDAEGNGHRGVAAREAFYDNFIAPADINLEIINSYAAGLECANNVVITTRVPGENGKVLQQMVHGIFTYEVNAEGKLIAMRGYWDTEDPINSLTEVDAA